MAKKTFVQLMMTSVFRVDVSYIDFYGDDLYDKPLPVNQLHRNTRAYEDETIAVQAKIPKLVDIVMNGGDFQLLVPKDSVKIYDICVGILDSWVKTLSEARYRGMVDLELLSGLDELANYVYPNTLRYRPATEDKAATMRTQLGAFMGDLTRNNVTIDPVEPEKPKYKPYVSRLSSITTQAIRIGLIKA